MTAFKSLALAASIALPGTLAALPAAALADRTLGYTTTPIAVQSCSLSSSSHYDPALTGMAGNGLTDGVAVGVVNNANASTTAVELSVEYNGYTRKLHDRMNVGPGARATRTLDGFAVLPGAAEDANCRVTAVSFDEGRSWQAPLGGSVAATASAAR